MSEWFASGRAVDLVLAVIAIEALWIGLRRRGDTAGQLLALVPGALLLLALRAALTGAGWPMVAMWLALSFPVHLADMARRGR
jgi:hypothetical protein